MARVSLPIFVLAFSVSVVGAYSPPLQCDDISNIVPRELKCKDVFCFPSEKWWDYGSPRQYKNRACNLNDCVIGPTDEDCVGDRSDSIPNCPFEPQIDPLPSDYAEWICPAHCVSMPAIPYQLKVVKIISFWESPSTRRRYETNTRTVEIPTPFKTEDASSNCVKKSADPNTYAVCTISNCKSQRKQDNFKARVKDCWQWNYRSGMPQMTHLDRMWTDKEAQAYDFAGIKNKEEIISSCPPVNDANPFKFHDAACWNEPAEDKKHKQFFIKPHYTYYRSMQSLSDRTDCRLQIVGSYADGNVLLPGEMNKWNINKHWQNPLTRRDHYYNVYPVFDGMQRSGFSGFHDREDKTIATWDYTIPCEYSYNNMKRSTNVIYAESGCTYPACVDFITKPCYDNVYRYDEMVCTLIRDNFKQGPILFSTFKEKIIRLIPYREPFMSYGLFGGNSYFDIWYDTAKVQVKRDETILDPNVPHVFADGHHISVALIRDATNAYSCAACSDIDLHGRVSTSNPAMANDITACKKCLEYEKVSVTVSSITYQDCVVCDTHQVRNEANAKQCMKCQDIDKLKPMRRKKTDTAGHTVCTACQHFQYFRGDSDAGCIFLQTVTDNIQVTNRKAVLSGKDFYITGDVLQEIEAKFWRDNILPTSEWDKELVPAACIPGYDIPTTSVPRLKFTAWCGHREMLRHQQAWVEVNASSLYVPLNADFARTRINTSVVELCGANALTQVSGNTTFDLACGSHRFSLVRSGFQDKCTLCVGAKYTDKCWPTYVDGLDLYDALYFDNRALTPQPGTCQDCNPRCHNTLQPDSYIDPIPYSCWWNGTGRVPGVLGAPATNFSWYKPAPCTRCGAVRLADDKAELVLACGNRVSYRRWLSDTVSGSELDQRSVPSTQICCVEKLADPATICTSDPAKFETFTPLNCKQTVFDTPPAFLPYCPPGWYADRTCANGSPAWNPDCCVRCQICRSGLFKLDAYKVCPGDEFFDSQDRGCTTKCLTNQYVRNDRCIKCEACE